MPEGCIRLSGESIFALIVEREPVIRTVISYRPLVVNHGLLHGRELFRIAPIAQQLL
ncbi:MAG: hypothetical protein Hyperionvirus3_4 [Hyperionvirus sp.]|uniref:Uncharacterized protein n=1 Tax=Hyperionvirus sp. TaxID=2487770 RepID=A0A3G5A6Q0_9VIRU|nr:MAG: hypothetical protein Hyperionvirus3_4 [Hyperionvirus sp.]